MVREIAVKIQEKERWTRWTEREEGREAGRKGGKEGGRKGKEEEKRERFCKPNVLRKKSKEEMNGMFSTTCCTSTCITWSAVNVVSFCSVVTVLFIYI